MQYALEQYMNELNTARKEGKTLPQIPKYIGECYWKLCQKMANRPNFYGYSFKDEMILDGIENCISAIENYNFEHPLKNPFGYFSRIAWRAFLRRIDKEKKQAYIKQKNHQNNYDVDQMYTDRHAMKTDTSYSDELITSFEKKHLIKTKKKTKVKGLEKFTEEEND